MQNTALKPIPAALESQKRRPQLRDYQERLKAGVLAEWAGGAHNVLAVLPVGGGKTVLFADIVAGLDGPVCAIAHRQELVAQISMAFARFGIKHRILAPNPVIKYVVERQIKTLGVSLYDPRAPVAVAGVDTLKARAGQLRPWLQAVKYWVQDEGHHVLADNKWGKAAETMPNARGLLVTATPERADGEGLGREADGIVDAMVVGPSLRDMIDLGWLTDYRIYAPPPSIHTDNSMVSATTGDFNRTKLAKASKGSTIVGDLVRDYQKYSPGKRGISFLVDVDDAVATANKFCLAGVPAEAISAKTLDAIRQSATDKLGTGELLQLTNVDIFGEGFDLPAVDTLSMGRPTQSFSLFVQMVGRVLRPVYAEGWPLDTPEQRKAAIAAGPKPIATIIDHVGNVARHAVYVTRPDGSGVVDICYRKWDLSGRDKRQSRKVWDDVVELTSCVNPECLLPYESVKPSCPHCGIKPVPAGRSGPEQVDGDLAELDPSTLQQIAVEVAKVDSNDPPLPVGAGQVAVMAARKRHAEKQAAQRDLRQALAWFGGHQRAKGRCDSEGHRRFYRLFGVDVLSAQALARRDAEALTNKIYLFLAEANL